MRRPELTTALYSDDTENTGQNKNDHNMDSASLVINQMSAGFQPVIPPA